jgi:hypothetical protein
MIEAVAIAFDVTIACRDAHAAHSPARPQAAFPADMEIARSAQGFEKLAVRLVELEGWPLRVTAANARWLSASRTR